MSARSYTFDDIRHLVVAHRWVILIPVALGLAAAPLLAELIPLRYQSDAIILVQAPQVSGSYVPQAAKEDIETRLPSITTRILSRNRLEQIILEMDLYKDERRREVMEDVVQNMRANDVRTSPTARGADSFRVSYLSDDASTAQRVTERLARLYIEENALQRASQAENTSELLTMEIGRVKQKLTEQEQRLAAYSRAHAGQLPTQLQGNMSAISSLNLELTQLSQEANNAMERRLLLEKDLAALDLVPLPYAPGAPVAPAQMSTSEQLELAKAERARRIERYRPGHPALDEVDRLVAELTEKVANEAPLSARTSAPSRPVSSAEAAQQQRRLQLQGQLEVLDRQLKQYPEREARLRRQLAAYQGRVEALPTREQELQELTREYNTLNSHYADLLLKRENATLSASMERREIGERFTLLDAASRPERPYNEMQRLGITFSGAGIGLGLAILFIGLREYRDSSFRSTDEVVKTLSLPVLGTIPVMTSAGERAAVARRGWALDIGGSALVLSSVAVVVVWQLLQ